MVARFWKVAARKQDGPIIRKQFQRCPVYDQAERDAAIDRANRCYATQTVHFLLDGAVFDGVSLHNEAEALGSFYFELNVNVETVLTRFRYERTIGFDIDVSVGFRLLVKVLDFANRITLQADAV